MSQSRSQIVLDPNGQAGPVAEPAPRAIPSVMRGDGGGEPHSMVRPRRHRWSVWPLLFLLLLMGGVAGGVWWWRRSGRESAKVARAVCQARRGDLPIVVTEGGSLEAIRSEIIKSEVEGHATIIGLIPEGTLITGDDVKQKRVLVELDSADLREKLTGQEIIYATAKSAYTEAKEGFDIQKSQAESDIHAGELNVKLDRMDLELYVGRDLSDDALTGRADMLKLAEQLHARACEHRRTIEADVSRSLAEVEQSLREAATESSDPAPGRSPARGAPAAATPSERPPQPPRAAAPKAPEAVDATDPKAIEKRIGGTALQKTRDLEADIGLAIEEFRRGAEKLVWTAKLERKGYVSHSELETDQLAFKRSLITLQQALTARELFLRYQFPKDAEKLLSGYTEAGRELERTKAKNRSLLAQAEAKLKSNEATYLLQENRLAKLRKQVEACTIHASQPGLVVYASSGDNWRQMNSPIELGASVHERQELIKLPDVSSLAVRVLVHESVVNKVKVGVEARVSVDAFPKLTLRGKVSKVAVLANSSNRWLNPDLKQYDTQVVIEDTPACLKPGMSAKVEILVGTLRDVLLVPVQAVTTRQGKTLVYVVNGGTETPREISVGESDDKLVEVRSGLAEGETILLEAPQTVTVEEERGDGEAGKKQEEQLKDQAGFPEGPRPPGPPEARPGTQAPTEPAGGPGQGARPSGRKDPRAGEPGKAEGGAPSGRGKPDATKR